MRYSGQPGRRSDGLEILASSAKIARDVGSPPEHLAGLRDEVIAALALADDRPVRTWSGLDLPGERSACSIEADRYVVIGPRGVLQLHRLSDPSQVRVLGADRPAARLWPVFVPGGRFLTIAFSRSPPELWDLERGEVPVAWPADVRCVASRIDGRQVAALRPGGELRVYDLPAMTEASRCRLDIDVPRRVQDRWMSLSGDGRYLALIPREDAKVALVYEAASGHVVRELEIPPARVTRNLALDRSGKLLAVSHDRAISVYDMADGERLALLQGHQSEEIQVQFQPVGGLLASTSWDGTTRLWEPIRGRLLATVTGYFQGWSGGGIGMAIGREKELVNYRIAGADEWRTIDCRVLGERAGAAQCGPARVAFSPDGRLIAMALRPEGVRIVRASDGAGLAHLPIGDCDEVLFLPGGSLLTHNRLGLCRWPLRRGSGGVWRIGPAEPLAAIEQAAGRMSFGLAAGGRLVGAISVSPSGVLLLDPDRPRRRTWLLPHRGLFHLALSPDGRWAATGSRDVAPPIRQVNVWDAATAKMVAQLPVGTARVAFSPDGRWLGVGGEARYRFFRTGSWTPGPEIPHGMEGGQRPLAFHPGGRIAAILHGNASMVQLVELETGRVLASLDPPAESPAYDLAFSPDGRFLAVAQTDQRVHIWDLALIRRRLEEMGLAAGLPDSFAGDATSGDPTAVERIEVEGADPAGIKLLAIRRISERAGSPSAGYSIRTSTTPRNC